MNQHQLIAEFQQRAQMLDNKARQIAPALFLFDEYHPKQIPEAVCDDETAFWYFIVDLYGLFFDSGKYLFFSNGWSDIDRKIAKAFQAALNELRSTFCHNKPPTAYLPLLITDNNQLGNLVTDWKSRSSPAKDLLSRDFNKTADPYLKLFFLFHEAGMKFLNLIDAKLLPKFDSYAQNQDDNMIYEQWFTPIFQWYRSNPTVYVRAWNSFCRCKPVSTTNQFYNQMNAHKIYGDLNWKLGWKEEEWKQFGHNMYCRHFSLFASTASRLNLTPFNLFAPLLTNFDTGWPPNKSLFMRRS